MSFDQPHTEIVADTDYYSGNFERELTAWVFGVVDDIEFPSPYLTIDPALDWARDDHGPAGALEITLHPDHGYWSWQKIEATPGWQNDGYGHHTRMPGACSAYQSVRWVFTRILSADETASVRERVLSFAAEWNRRMADSERDDAVIAVEGLRVFDVVETQTETFRSDSITAR